MNQIRAKIRKYRGNNIPVTVLKATEEQIYDAYVLGDSDFLDEHAFTFGLVNGRWVGKACS